MNIQRILLAYMVAGGITPSVLFGAESFTDDSVDVGLRKQLLVDDHVVAETKNLTRRIGTVTKANDGQPLHFTRLTKDGRRVPVDVWPLFTTVYYDVARQRFRMWHRVSFYDKSRRGDEEKLTTREIGVGVGYQRAYSESRDGIHFQFVSPLKGITTGSDMNLVVTVDEYETDPEHRYKIGYDSDSEVHAATLAHSADGIHWTPYNDERPVTYRAADFTNQITWDDDAKLYRLFTRTDFGWGGGPLAGTVGRGGGRPST